MNRLHSITRLMLGGIILALLVAGIYAPVARHGFITYDDPEYVTDNLEVRGGLSWEGIRWAFGTTHAANWHPLTWLSHQADVELFGLRAGGHHLMSVLIHLLAAVGLFLALRGMTGALWPSLLVAALFAAHPLHVESVAWAAERKDVLAGLGFMATLLAYLHYLRRPGALRLSAVSALFAVALLAKPMVVTLPLVLLLLDRWPLGRWKPGMGRRLAAEKMPLLVLAAAVAAVTMRAQAEWGALRSSDVVPLPARLGNAAVSAVSYLMKTAWPARLAVYYPHPGLALPWWQAWGATALLAAVTAAALRLRDKSPSLLTGWGWYLVMLAPVAGLVQAGGQGMADRYTYLPLIGIFAAVVWGLAGTAGRRPAAAAGPAAVLLLLLALAARRQVGYWKDSETLFRHALAVTGEDNRVARDNLGQALLEKGKMEEAGALFSRAAAADPRDADARYFLGNILLARGYVEQAVARYREALLIDPGHFQASNNLGVALGRQGKNQEAVVRLRESVRLYPALAGNWTAYLNLGAALHRLGRDEEAMRIFREILRLDPVNPEANFRLGEALAAAGRVRESSDAFREAVRLSPDRADIRTAFGIVLARAGRPAEAEREFREALRLAPADAQAWDNLANVLAVQGKHEQALREYAEALLLAPANAMIHANLGNLLLSMKRPGEAQREFREALRLEPGQAAAREALARLRGGEGR